MTKELTNWYKTYISSKTYTTNFLSTFSRASNDDEKAMVLLTGELTLKRGNHMWYLWRFSRNWPSRDEILRRIKDYKLWAASVHHLSNFEDLYKFVWNTLNVSSIPQIQQLVVYDVAAHLADLNGGHLKPKDYVYLHALPLSAAKVIQNNGFMGGVIIKAQNPIKDLSTHFPSLPAYEIEDLLCHAGKSIRRVGHHKTSRLPEEVAIDAIVSKHIKNFKPIIP